MLKDIDPRDAEPLKFCTSRLMAILGIPYNASTAEHLEVMLEALQIHAQRTELYGDQWRESGALSNIDNAVRKTKRQRKQMDSAMYAADIDVGYGQSALAKGSDDDAIDAINYCTFFVRNIRNGNISGTD